MNQVKQHKSIEEILDDQNLQELLDSLTSTTPEESSPGSVPQLSTRDPRNRSQTQSVVSHLNVARMISSSRMINPVNRINAADYIDKYKSNKIKKMQKQYSETMQELENAEALNRLSILKCVQYVASSFYMENDTIQMYQSPALVSPNNSVLSSTCHAKFKKYRNYSSLSEEAIFLIELCGFNPDAINMLVKRQDMETEKVKTQTGGFAKPLKFLSGGQPINVETQTDDLICDRCYIRDQKSFMTRGTQIGKIPWKNVECQTDSSLYHPEACDYVTPVSQTFGVNSSDDEDNEYSKQKLKKVFVQINQGSEGRKIRSLLPTAFTGSPLRFGSNSVQTNTEYAPCTSRKTLASLPVDYDESPVHYNKHSSSYSPDYYSASSKRRAAPADAPSHFERSRVSSGSVYYPTSNNSYNDAADYQQPLSRNSRNAIDSNHTDIFAPPGFVANRPNEPRRKRKIKHIPEYLQRH